MADMICSICKSIISWPDNSNPPTECPNCLEPVKIQSSKTPTTKAVEQVVDNSGSPAMPPTTKQQPEQVPEVEREPDGLVLIYETNGRELRIPFENCVKIGRNYPGAIPVFGAVKQISREHCEILFENGQYFVNDLGSTHGTFVGLDKIDCCINPKQPLVDNSMLYLGREPFRVQLCYREIEPEPAPPAEPRAFRCTECGEEFAEKTSVCPACAVFESWENVY